MVSRFDKVKETSLWKKWGKWFLYASLIGIVFNVLIAIYIGNSVQNSYEEYQKEKEIAYTQATKKGNGDVKTVPRKSQDVSVKVLGSKKMNASDQDWAKEDEELLVLEVMIKNNSSKEFTFHPGDFNLVDSFGAPRKPSLSFLTAQKALGVENLKPFQSSKGTLTFFVPKHQRNFTLQFVNKKSVASSFPITF